MGVSDDGDGSPPDDQSPTGPPPTDQSPTFYDSGRPPFADPPADDPPDVRLAATPVEPADEGAADLARRAAAPAVAATVVAALLVAWWRRRRRRRRG